MPVPPHLDQIPGSCRDYFTAQGWVDFNNGEYGITIATPENPIVQLGDLHFAQHQQDFALEYTMFLGWVTNNYWKTNFPVMQPGVGATRYIILPFAGDFDELRAHQVASASEHSRPLIMHLGEPAAYGLLPESGMLLQLLRLSIPTLNLSATPEGGAMLTLFNASDISQTTTVSSGLIWIREVHLCDLSGKHLDGLTVNNGAGEIAIAPPNHDFEIDITILTEEYYDKIAFIGACSFGFARELVRDILTLPLLADAEIASMDINPERRDFSKRSAEKIISLGKYPATVSATLDRVEALHDADVVLTTILAGATNVWWHDIEIPKNMAWIPTWAMRSFLGANRPGLRAAMVLGGQPIRIGDGGAVG